jgi:uncharacterized protein (TIGR02594 family)
MATVALSLSAIVNPTPASAAPARSHHGHVVKVKPSAHASHRAIHRKAHAGKRHSLRRHRYHRSEATQSDNGFGFGGFSSFGGSGGLVDAARSYIGRGNPTARGRLWCAAFMNLVLQRTGHQGTGSDMARSFSSYGQRLSGPQVGAIAVMSRGRRGGHVGVVSGVDDKGNPIIVSGNHGNRVAESVYSKGRVYAYVMPN